MSLLDLASLVLAPTATKEGKVYSAIPDTGEGDMTFTRGSAATRVNSAGLIEKERANLLLQSNTFDTTWATSVDITVTSGQAGYDGSNDAWLLKRSSNASRFIYQNLSASSSVYTLSFYGKPESEDWVYLYSFDGSGAITAYFDLQNGVVGVTSGSVISTNIEAAGNGYYRCSLTYNASVTQVRIYPAVGNGSVTGGVTDAGIYIQDAMLNEGLVAFPYIETTTTAVYEGITDDVPRVDYSGGGCPSLLLEPQRTNLVTQSEYFNDFTDTGLTLNVNDATSPEGVINAYKLTEDSANSQHKLRKDFSVSAGTHTVSVFVKGTSRYVSIYPQFATVAYAVYDLSNQTVTDTGGANYVSSDIIDYGNDWYRLILTCNTSANTMKLNFYLSNSATSEAPTYTGDGSSYLHFYGAMLEAGNYSTSYIPTYGTSTSRSADSCSLTGASNLIGQTEGTLFIDFKRPANALQANQVIYGITDTGSQNRLRILTTGSNPIRVLFQTNGNQIEYDVNLSGALSPDDTPIKLAVAYKSGDIACYINGTQADTSSNSITITTSVENVEIGYTNNSNIVSQAILFPTRLTNDQLAELTK